MTEAARRRRSTVVPTLALASLALTAVVGCGSIDKALDCVRTADAIATSVDNLQQAVSNASNDPTQASEALDEIDRELGNLGDRTDDADLSKAVDHLRTGAQNVRDSIDRGDSTPDLSPVTEAAQEIGRVCTP
ncbi:hypothetical protein AB0L71_31015 [Streptomyces sp. NPDC052052]|uniref:hypothetical protein n=1 Tax=Streptomyces sp. NPDC052052 TaxID=3154756 RepID=UPI003419B997